MDMRPLPNLQDWTVHNQQHTSAKRDWTQHAASNVQEAKRTADVSPRSIIAPHDLVMREHNPSPCPVGS